MRETTVALLKAINTLTEMSHKYLRAIEALAADIDDHYELYRRVVDVINVIDDKGYSEPAFDALKDLIKWHQRHERHNEEKTK